MIRFGGREMPRGARFADAADGRVNAPTGESRIRIPDVAVDERQREFEEKLRQTIRRESGVDAFRTASIVDRDDLVKAYRKTLGALKRLSTDWHGFVEKLIRIDLRCEKTLPEKANKIVRKQSKEWRTKLLADVSLRPVYFSSALTAELISQDLGVAFSGLVDDIERKIETLHAAILDQLVRLMEAEVCGFLVRYPNQVYAYHYFFRELNAKARSYTKTETGNPVDPINGLTQPFSRTSRVVEANMTLTLCRRVHHIINGIEISPDRPSIPTPPYHQGVLDAIPLWLRPMTILVEGTLVGEAAVDQDVSQCAVAVDEELLHAWYHRDPALVLGQIVLTGWGPRELEADTDEENKRHATEAGEVDTNGLGSRLSASWKAISLIPAKALAAGVCWADDVRDREE